MATKTAPKPSAVVDRAIDDYETIDQAAEDIIWNLSPGAVPSGRQWRVLQAAGIEGHAALERELGRVACVRRHMLAAGTADELAEAQAVASEAARVEAEQRPALETQAAEIADKLKRLAANREAAQVKLEAMRVARDHLREPRLLPSFVRAALEQDGHRIQLGHCQRISELETECTVIQQLQRIGPDSRDAQLHLESAAPESLDLHNGAARIDPQVWRRYVERRALELPELEQQLATARDGLRAALEPVERQRDFYLRQLV